MQQISMKIVLLISIFVIIGGCVVNPSQRYSGDHLAKSNHATLKPWENGIQQDSSGSLMVLPESIDGKEVDTPSLDKVSITTTTYLISPGERTIKVILLANIAGDKKGIRSPDPLILQAKTGHVYVTKANVKILKRGDVDTKVQLSFWIEDEKTGELVSGSRLAE